MILPMGSQKPGFSDRPLFFCVSPDELSAILAAGAVSELYF
jgi:hypothetical protein